MQSVIHSPCCPRYLPTLASHPPRSRLIIPPLPLVFPRRQRRARRCAAAVIMPSVRRAQSSWPPAILSGSQSAALSSGRASGHTPSSSPSSSSSDAKCHGQKFPSVAAAHEVPPLIRQPYAEQHFRQREWEVGTGAFFATTGRHQSAVI